MFRCLILIALLTVPSLGARLRPHIVNGKDVDFAGKYKFQASFQYYKSHECGAAIISTRYLLTAAHCIFGFSETVVVGAHDIRTLVEGKPTRYEVDWTKTHPKYGEGTGMAESDIAIVHVKEDIIMNQYVGTIDLPNEDDGELVGAACVITGWGNTEIGLGSWGMGGGYSDIYSPAGLECRGYGMGSTGAPNYLQEGNTTPLSLAACKNAIKDHPSFTEDHVVASHICVGAQGSGFAGGCHQDSGGPLSCDFNGKTILAGLTSWGSPDCDPKWPTMYTRVTSFRGWVRDNTGI